MGVGTFHFVRFPYRLDNSARNLNEAKTIDTAGNNNNNTINNNNDASNNNNAATATTRIGNDDNKRAPVRSRGS
jgi:hypothetical protein